MKYDSKKMEEQSLMQSLAKMCATIRTAPKARGMDHVDSLVLTGEDKDLLAEKMREIATWDEEALGNWYRRDAGNVDTAQAVVLVGVKNIPKASDYCGLCGFKNCKGCNEAGGFCSHELIDLGIALGAAVATTATEVDSRIMYTVGKAAHELNLMPGFAILGIPISISGKSPFFDRAPSR